LFGHGAGSWRRRKFGSSAGENGGSEFKIHLSEYLSVSPAMAVGYGCAVERQSLKFTLLIYYNSIIFPLARHKHELLHSLFNNMAER
jgi:hypothetical protein